MRPYERHLGLLCRVGPIDSCSPHPSRVACHLPRWGRLAGAHAGAPLLNQGERKYHVYFALDKKKKLVYTGITRQSFIKRLYQHNYSKNPSGPKKFIGLVNVFGEQSESLTGNMVHAIEQFLIEYGPNKKNKINSISPNSKHYDESMQFAYNYIKQYLDNNTRRE